MKIRNKEIQALLRTQSVWIEELLSHSLDGGNHYYISNIGREYLAIDYQVIFQYAVYQNIHTHYLWKLNATQ